MKLRHDLRRRFTAEDMIYDKHGRLLVACRLGDLSPTGARIELDKNVSLPHKLVLPMTRDGAANAPKSGVRTQTINHTEAGSMQEVTTIGLDIAKLFFQVHGIDCNGQVIIQR
jgi:DNA-binding XRE family transcriptional regulator